MHRILSSLALAISTATLPVGAQEYLTYPEVLELGLKPALFPENQPHLKENLLAWVDKDSLHFAKLDRIYVTTLCAEPHTSLRRLPSLPLPMPKSSAPPTFGLLTGKTNIQGAGALSATIAIALPGGTLHRLVLSMATEGATAWTVVKRDSVKLALGAGERPTLLVAFAEAAKGRDSALILSGTGGLLRILERTAAGLTQAGSLSAPDEDLVAFGDGLFGGAKGGIYRWGVGNPPLVRLARPFQVPVRAVDSTGALGDEGWAAVRLAAGWQGYPLEPGRFLGFKVDRDSGLGIRRYPDTGAPVRSRLRDSPSRIAAFTSGLGDPGPAGNDGKVLAYSASMGTLAVKVPLNDSESTFSPPGVALIGQDTLPMTPGFIRSGPATGCAGLWGLCVQSDAAFLGLALSADSVVLSMTVQSSRFIFAGGCSDYGRRRDSLYRMAAPWREGHRIRIQVGDDLLTLMNTGSMRIAPDRLRASLGEEGAVYDALGRSFRIRKWAGAAHAPFPSGPGSR